MFWEKTSAQRLLAELARVRISCQSVCVNVHVRVCSCVIGDAVVHECMFINGV